jgi:integrase
MNMVQISARSIEARSIRSLPLKEWSEADRNGWQAACRPGQRLTRGGAASQLAPVTQADLANRFGLYLDFVDRSGQLDLTAEAAALITPDSIAGFIAELQARVSSVTVSRTIYKVRRAAECIAPDRNFAWLAEIGKDLALLERPKDKFDRIVLTERLVEAALVSFWEVDSDPELRPLARAFAARNALMVALLAACPIRLKNFAGLKIGGSFGKIGETWWIFLKETKSRRADHRPVPSFLTGAIERYLDFHRPILLGNPAGDKKLGKDYRPRRQKSTRVRTASALWISRLHGPLSYDLVERVITQTTYQLLRVAVSPHLFRVAGATTAALYAPRSPHLASALLQHSDPRITEEHYQRASSLSVARDFAKLVRDLRQSKGRKS